MALRAVRIHGSSHDGVVWVIQPPMIGAMARMAAQAQERRRLVEQMVGYRSMRLMADTAILRHRRVFVSKGSLFLRMTAVANHVDRRFSEPLFGLSVRVVTVRTDHFALADRMMRRQIGQGIHPRMALVTNLRLLDRHDASLRASDGGMADVQRRLHVRARMRMMAIGASDTGNAVRRRVPSHRRRAALMAAQAQFLPRRFGNLAVGIVAAGTIEPVHPADLMRPGHTLEFPHVRVTLVARLGRRGPQVARGHLPQRLRFRLAFAPIADHCRHIVWSGAGSRLLGRLRLFRGPLVMRSMAIQARNAVVRMNRSPPLSCRGTSVILVTAPADFRALGGRQVAEAPNQSRLLARGLDVLAGRAVASLARFAVADSMMDVLPESIRVGFMAIGALFVSVFVLGACDGRQLDAQFGQFHLAKGVIGPGPAGPQISVVSLCVRDDAGTRRHGKAGQCQQDTARPKNRLGTQDAVGKMRHRLCSSAVPPCSD